jgi:AmiR/NasT family two-component response regulator
VAGALNAYASATDAFADDDRQIGLIIADHAALALDYARVRDEAEREAGELRTALQSRDVIGQAKGILMERSGLDADEAFAVLRLLSQRRNVKLREVAADVAKSVVRRRPPTA